MFSLIKYFFLRICFSGYGGILATDGFLHNNPDHVAMQLRQLYHSPDCKVNGTDCADTIAKAVSVYANPQAAINANTMGNCNNRDLDLQIGNSSDLIYGWNFGDGTGSYEANPSHGYTNFGAIRLPLSLPTAMVVKDTAGTNHYHTADTEKLARGKPIFNTML